MRKQVLLLSGIIETMGAFVVYMRPDIIFSQDDATPLIFQLYGLTMFVLGFLCISAYRYYVDSQFFKSFFLAMMFFHGALSVKMYTVPAELFTYKWGACITHGVLFVLFVISYLSDIKKAA